MMRASEHFPVVSFANTDVAQETVYLPKEKYRAMIPEDLRMIMPIRQI